MKKILLVFCAFVSGSCGASSSGAANGLFEQIKGITYHNQLVSVAAALCVRIYEKAPFMEGLTFDDVVTVLEENHPECSKSQLELANVYYDLYRYSDYHKHVDVIGYLKKYEKWIALAAAQEDPEAMYLMGTDIIEKNEKKAVALIKGAAEKGYSPALYLLAAMQEHGLFVSKNQAEAVERYELAANMMHGAAQIKMWRRTALAKYGVSKKDKEYARWLFSIDKRWRQLNERRTRISFKREGDILTALNKIRCLTSANKYQKKAFYAPTLKMYFKEMRRAKVSYEHAEIHGYLDAHVHLEALSNILAKGESRKHNVKFQIIQRPPSVSYPKRHHHAVIGLCPGTSYYTPEVIASYIQWSRKTFTQVTFFIPTGWSIHNYRARGMSEKTSSDRTRKADRQIQSKYFAAFDLIGVPKSVALRLLVLASELEKNPVYQAAYAQCLHQYQTDVGFRGVCRAQTATYMKLSDEGAIEEAVKYLLRELPLFFASSAIFGVPSSYNVYHDIPEFINLTPEGAQQGFIKAEVKEQSSACSSSSSCGD